MPSDKDDWKLPAARDELALKIKPTLPGQSDIEHQAGGAVRRIRLEKVGNRRKQPRLEIERSQQTPKRGAKLRIVVNDQDGRFRVRHPSYSRSRNRRDESYCRHENGGARSTD